MKPPLNSNSSAAWALRSTLWRLGRLLPVLAALDELRQKPQLSQERPTETNRKKAGKKIAWKKGRVSANPESLSSPEAAQLNKGAGEVPTHQRQWLDVSNCRDVGKASGHGLRLLSTPKMGVSMMDWYDWWLFQNTLVVFFWVFGRGWKTIPNYGK